MNKKERKKYNKEIKKAVKQIKRDYSAEQIADGFILPQKLLSKKKEKEKAEKIAQSLRYAKILNRLVVIGEKVSNIEKLLSNN